MSAHNQETAAKAEGGTRPLEMIWCELTAECQLECVMCYAGSGPGRGHGTMTAAAWEDVIGQAAALGAGRAVFIGGEPTLHPDLGRLVRAALAAGMAAEVYSNLVHVTPALWELFSLPGVSLAASWYTGDRAQHEAVTGRDTWRQTRANFAGAVRRGIPVRAGIIGGIVPGQRTEDGERELRALGVTDIGYDRVREFGRGTVPDPSQACGNCGRGRAAVLPDGSVTPCPMTRWMRAGDVRETELGAILGSVTAAVSALRPGRGLRTRDGDCRPDVYCQPLCSPSPPCKPSI